MRTTNRDVLAAGVLGVMAALFGNACASEKGPAPEVRAPVVVLGTPTLVAIEDDVWVVRDTTRAVYFVDGWYWMPTNERGWLRSRSYEDGWVAIDDSAVPARIANRNHAYYALFHGEESARTRRPPIGERMILANEQAERRAREEAQAKRAER
jgi:hypothetical protein